MGVFLVAGSSADTRWSHTLKRVSPSLEFCRRFWVLPWGSGLTGHAGASGLSEGQCEDQHLWTLPKKHPWKYTPGSYHINTFADKPL